MNILEFSGILFVCGYCAGMLGAITGLGGGIVVVPALTLLFGIDIHLAMGAGLLVAIATSSGVAQALIREKFTNVRLGMFLEIAAVIGAIVGALLVPYLPKDFIAILFGSVLLFAIWVTASKFKYHSSTRPSHPIAKKLHLDGEYQTKSGLKHYEVYNVPTSFVMMGVAGLFSGLLGIGSGVFKVLVYDTIMRLPFKVATSTCIFMIGMTAAASAGVYFSSGYINPYICFPIIPAVLLGSFTGAKILIHARPDVLRLVFNILVVFMALKMIYTGVTG